MTRKPLDFAKVEELRSHMLIPIGDWAKILGASRMAYYKWVVGKSKIRPTREDAVRLQVKRLLAAMAAGWPAPEIYGLDPSRRAAKLLALMDQA